MNCRAAITLFSPFIGTGGGYCTVGNQQLIQPLEELEKHEINYRKNDAGPSWFVLDHGQGKLIGCVDRVDTVAGIDRRFTNDSSGRRMSFAAVYELPPGSPVPPQSAWPELRRLVDADLRRAVQIVQDNKSAITSRQNDPIFSSLPRYDPDYTDSHWDAAAKKSAAGRPVGIVCVDQVTGEIKFDRAAPEKSLPRASRHEPAAKARRCKCLDTVKGWMSFKTAFVALGAGLSLYAFYLATRHKSDESRQFTSALDKLDGRAPTSSESREL